MVRRWLTLFVIVTAPSGCDNVAWGGFDMRLEAPPPRAEVAGSTPSEVEATDAPLPELPAGPILLAGVRDGSSATLRVVGEVGPEGLLPLTREEDAPGFTEHFARQLLAPGREFILFSEGVRVGRMTVSESQVDGTFCQPRPTVTGVVEMVPDAANAVRLLALPADGAAARPFETHRSWTHDYDQRVASLTLAQQAIPVVGAAWPPSLLESRADIQIFRLPEASGPSVVATFLYGDRLAQGGPTAEGAYSLFVMGTQADGDYRRSFTWYRPVQTEGKGAPRFFDHLDWDGDGSSEVLLDVFGAEGRWYAALERATDGWNRSFQDSCGAGGAAG